MVHRMFFLGLKICVLSSLYTKKTTKTKNKMKTFQNPTVFFQPAWYKECMKMNMFDCVLLHHPRPMSVVLLVHIYTYSSNLQV